MDLLHDGPADAPLTLVLAHGAGTLMDHPFLETVARGLAEAGVHVVRFEFPYMVIRRATGKRRPPDRMPALEASYRQVLAQVGGRLVLGGQSMGGRVAARLAAEPQARGVLVLGYPFHPPKKPEKLRLEPLAAPPVPVLVLQGERDPFGTPAQVATYALGETVQVGWLPDGDHSFVPRKRSGHTEAGNLASAIAQAAAFLLSLPGAAR